MGTDSTKPTRTSTHSTSGFAARANRGVDSDTPPGSEPRKEPEAPRALGRVQRIYPERGFGFIRCTEGGEVGQDYFFHMSGLDDTSIEALEEGSMVTFEVRQVAKGRRAEHIQRVS